MLFSSHNRAYQDFLTLLTELDEILKSQNYSDIVERLKTERKILETYFQQNIADLTVDGGEFSRASRWQSLQTELKREFKLLNTEIIFFSAARQQSNQIKRIAAVQQHLDKLIAYNQLILAEVLEVD